MLIFIFGHSHALNVKIFNISNDVVSMINSIREDPIGYAQSIGLSISDMDDIWGYNLQAFYYGLMPLNKSNILEKQALDYLNAVLKGNSFNFLDNRVLISSKIELYVAFEHAISPEEAAKIMISQIVAGALRGDRRFSAILYPPFTDIGAVMAGAEINISGTKYNVYALILILGIAEDAPLADYLVGKLADNVISIECFNSKDFSRAFIWPDRLYFCVVKKGIYFIHIKEKVNGRIVSSVVKKSFRSFPVRRDF